MHSSIAFVFGNWAIVQKKSNKFQTNAAKQFPNKTTSEFLFFRSGLYLSRAYENAISCFEWRYFLVFTVCSYPSISQSMFQNNPIEYVIHNLFSVFLECEFFYRKQRREIWKKTRQCSPPMTFQSHEKHLKRILI